MPESHADKVGNRVDAREFKVHLPEGLRRALGDLAAAIHFSEHFDDLMLENLEDWAAGRPLALHGFVASLPAIVEETMKHIAASGDSRAAKALASVQLELQERGFVLERYRGTRPRT
jgi:hypothetical protein